jgi:hypothetical protein
MSRPPATKATAETAELPSISGAETMAPKTEVVAARRRRMYFIGWLKVTSGRESEG